MKILVFQGFESLDEQKHTKIINFKGQKHHDSTELKTPYFIFMLLKFSTTRQNLDALSFGAAI